MPRKRGTISLGRTWPVIHQLRQERFDKSVDFASNDRGAIASFVIGAKIRLGRNDPNGFWGRKYCYTQCVSRDTTLLHQSAQMAQILSAWEIPAPRNLKVEIYSDPALAAAAKEILPGDGAIICHVASSQPKKEWPLGHWARLHRMAKDAGKHVVFTTARGEREQSLMIELEKLAPDATILPLIAELPLFLAVLQRAAVFISGDTGPLHFAAGLGVPTISLFGPSSPSAWAPVGGCHQALAGSSCSCDGNLAVCQRHDRCIDAILPEQIWERIKKALP